MAKVPKVPRKYTAGLSESTAAKRKAEIRKRTRGKDSFKPLPGDAKAETRESQYTKRAAGIREQIKEATPKSAGKTAREKYLNAAARVTGIPKRILEAVYNKGLAAWAVGHRPGASQEAWAKARLYSFLTGGKTTESADAALYLQAKKALKNKSGKFRLP